MFIAHSPGIANNFLWVPGFLQFKVFLDKNTCHIIRVSLGFLKRYFTLRNSVPSSFYLFNSLIINAQQALWTTYTLNVCGSLVIWRTIYGRSSSANRQKNDSWVAGRETTFWRLMRRSFDHIINISWPHWQHIYLTCTLTRHLSFLALLIIVVNKQFLNLFRLLKNDKRDLVRSLSYKN